MDRTCLHCGGPLPAGSRRGRLYCSKTCNNKMIWARDHEQRLAANREWRAKTAERRATARLAAKPERSCDWCGSVLPKDSRSRRRFCNVTCKNRFSVRRDRERRVAANKAWIKSHPSEYKARTDAYRDRARENCRRYYRDNPGVYSNLRHLRRVREQAAGGPGVSHADWMRTLRRHGHRCVYCGISGEMTMDHVVPVSRGGWHAIGNILPACRACNTSKSNRLLFEWKRIRSPQVSGS